ncbi:MAG: DUF6056 family protein [Treponema sp.]|nr:DUF6056 family protein [Treponema sp.]
MKNNMISNIKISHILWFVYIVIIFTYLLIINIKTPIIGEDFAHLYYNENNSELIKSIINGVLAKLNPGDLTFFNLRHGDTFVQLWLNLGVLFGIGKHLFSVLNVIITIIFFLLIYFWSNCRLPDIKSFNDLVIFMTIPLLFLICSYSIGELFFWCSGAAGYIWTSTILLSVAMPYRKYLNDDSYRMKNIYIFIYMLLSYYAAFTNENTVPVIILLGGFLLLRDIIKKGIKNISIWLLLSVLSMGAGYSVLIFSPNTARRTLVYRDMFNLPEKISFNEIKNNMDRVIQLFLESNYRFIILFFICLFIGLLIYFIYNKKNINIGMNIKAIILCITIGFMLILPFIRDNILRIIIIGIFINGLVFIILFINRKNDKIKILYDNYFILLISLISIITLFFAPYTEIRSFIFIQIFIITIIIRINNEVLYISLKEKNNIIKYIPNFCISLISIFYIIRLTTWTFDYYDFNKMRMESINNQIRLGETNIIAKIYHTERNKYINTREEWIKDSRYGGQWYYTRYLNIDNIVWSILSYEEMTKGLGIIANIKVPNDVNNILSYDIKRIEYRDDILILECGVIDPHINIPLEYTIKKPLGEPFLEILCTNSKAGIIQIFYDYGIGFNEKDSIRHNIDEINDMLTLRLPIAGWMENTNLFSIRIDPPDGTVFEINKIQIGIIN